MTDQRRAISLNPEALAAALAIRYDEPNWASPEPDYRCLVCGSPEPMDAEQHGSAHIRGSNTNWVKFLCDRCGALTEIIARLDETIDITIQIPGDRRHTIHRRGPVAESRGEDR